MDYRERFSGILAERCSGGLRIMAGFTASDHFPTSAATYRRAIRPGLMKKTNLPN